MATPFKFKNADGTTVDFEDYYVRADYFRSGNLWVWGDNTSGQLGDNTTTLKSSPVQTVAWGSNWKQAVCGTQTAVLKTDGTLWCWGSNASGILGDNTTTAKSSPVQTVAYGTNWKFVTVGNDNNTACIKTDGTLWLWGRNVSGQIGDNTTTAKSSPVQTVAGGNNWNKADLGISQQFASAIKSDGTLWCWGENIFGQLGDNTVIKKSSPVQTVAYGTNWKDLSCGGIHAAAIKTDGTLWGWSYNGFGQLGDNTTTSRSSPVQTVAFGTNWKQVSCGGSHTLAIKTDGTLWGWGYNNYGQLGDNTLNSRSSPVQTITFATNWKQVACGYHHAAAIKTDGTLWVWGRNSYGQLGDNTTIHKSSPVQTVAFGTNWKQVECSQKSTVAIQYQDDYQ